MSHLKESIMFFLTENSDGRYYQDIENRFHSSFVNDTLAVLVAEGKLEKVRKPEVLVHGHYRERTGRHVIYRVKA